MNKYLLAGCAAAALTLCGGIANAQDFKVTLSGEVKFESYFASQDKDSNTRAVDFRNRFRFVVNPEAVGLNGALTYGATVKVKNENTNSTTSFEANYIYLKGAFGSVQLGSQTTYDDDVGFGAPNGFISEWDGPSDFVGAGKDAAYNSTATGLAYFDGNTIADQSHRIRYDSPYISGVQLAVTYAPETTTPAWGWDRAKSSKHHDEFEVAAKFDSTDKSIADKFGAALLQAEVDYTGASAGSGTGLKNMSALKGALRVGYAGFKVGGYYLTWGKTDVAKTAPSSQDHYTYGFGASYETGPWVVGANYVHWQQDANLNTTYVGSGKKTEDYIITGVAYTVAKGLNAYADYAYARNKNTLANTKDTANVFVVGTVLSF